MNTDPRRIIQDSPMGALQILVVALTVALNALDGFDVMSISFASPGIAAEWHVTKAALGVALSMDLIGMAIGSILLGSLADRIGRRPTMLLCLVLMVTGMAMVTTVTGLSGLYCWRIVTGLGIGGLLAAVNAVTAEYANARRRDLSVSFMSIGYPVGAVLGGIIVAQLLKDHSWRSVFWFGTGFTALLLPLVFLFVPESVHWLAQKQPSGALDKINTALRRMGHPQVAALPQIEAAAITGRFTDIFSPALLGTTVLLTLAYFFHALTFYFVLKWVPKIVVDMGFAASSAAGVLVWANVGGASGGAVLGLLTQRFPVRGLTIAVMLLSTIGVIVFGHSPKDLQSLSALCAFSGFFTNAAIVGMYAIFARAYPTSVRAFGTGWSIGVGRGGAVLAPMIAGVLFEGGHPVSTVATILALGSLLAAGAVSLLKLKPEQAAAAGADRLAGAAAPGH